jgi:hypothetical protein
LPQLDSGSTNFIHFLLGGLWLEMKKVAENIEMGFYPKKCFTEMDKDGDVNNRVGVETIELDAIIEKKTTEEIRSGRANPRSTKC